MKKVDPIRMSDFHRPRAIAYAPGEAARQFRISAVLAGAIIMATAAVAAGTLSQPSYQAQAPATFVIESRPS